MGQDVLVDVGLTWRVSPYVHEGRTSRTTIKTRESISSWETIAGMLLRETHKEISITKCTWEGVNEGNIIAACSDSINHFQMSIFLEILNTIDTIPTLISI